ncbi:hypothetical protein LWI29_012883 [Acer saccharum]|uniref:Uncharacterized protein n=1 Tax=Acer saccharum TaxID=4024 RepID=A0AA39SSE6_ACESA|nr:hypothetical protein LWI29_012883 [Acer saccharum]
MMMSKKDDWSALDDIALDEIAGRITLYRDFAAFRMVCTSWQSSLQNFKFKCRMPWLMLPPKKGSNLYGFFIFPQVEQVQGRITQQHLFIPESDIFPPVQGGITQRLHLFDLPRYTTEGSSIKFQRTFDCNLKGFAVCAVIAFEKSFFKSNKLRVHFHGTVSDGDQSSPTRIMWATVYVASRNRKLIYSDHVAFGYCYASYHWLLGRRLKNYSFEFRPSEESPNCIVKSCGVCPIYYHQEFVTDEAGTSGNRFDEEEMEPHPKEKENLQTVKYAAQIEHIGETSGIRKSRTSNDHLEEEVEPHPKRLNI